MKSKYKRNVVHVYVILLISFIFNPRSYYVQTLGLRWSLIFDIKKDVQNVFPSFHFHRFQPNCLLGSDLQVQLKDKTVFQGRKRSKIEGRMFKNLPLGILLSNIFTLCVEYTQKRIQRHVKGGGGVPIDEYGINKCTIQCYLRWYVTPDDINWGKSKSLTKYFHRYRISFMIFDQKNLFIVRKSFK